MPDAPFQEGGTIDQALSKIYDEGREEMTQQDNVRDHMRTLETALLRAAQQPGAEIRLTYKTTARALVAWSWMIVAAERAGFYDKARSSKFNVELTNGSGIMFWTDEGREDETVRSRKTPRKRVRSKVSKPKRD